MEPVGEWNEGKPIGFETRRRRSVRVVKEVLFALAGLVVSLVLSVLGAGLAFIVTLMYNRGITDWIFGVIVGLAVFSSSVMKWYRKSGYRIGYHRGYVEGTALRQQITPPETAALGVDNTPADAVSLNPVANADP